jgi:hypothetical protein
MSAQAIEQLDLLAEATAQAIAARNVGMATTFENDLNAEYRDRLLGAIEILAIRGETFCSDDARALAGDPPHWVHPNIAGSVFNAASRAGIIRAVGMGYSRRVIGHHNRVLLWVGV